MGTAPGLVGRSGELDVLGQVLREALSGRAGAVLVSGEAGVGKTALVRAACDALGPEVAVGWGTCLPLTSLTAPFAPLRSAVRGLVASAASALPAAPGSATWPEGLDDWLGSLCDRLPVVLVVDDLQWADQSSLDVLHYLLAGPADRRLALVVTVRSDEVPVAHPLRRWLADARRLPGFEDLRLDRLDRVGTERQLAGLLGRPPHQDLVDAVVRRTRGNPYLTRLLAHGLSPDARSLPDGLPGDLRDAVARSWHGLDDRARTVTRLLAVAGRPQRADVLAAVARAAGADLDVLAQLQAAVDNGVLVVEGDDTYWFVHPLTAEVLAGGLLPETRRTYHAAFAAVLRLGADTGDDAALELVVALADHFHQAGDPAEAYRWALRAAEATERAGGAAEMLRLLRRACDLRPSAADDERTRTDLLLRLRTAAERCGAQEAELVAVDTLLDVGDGDIAPLRRAELLVRRSHLRQVTGRQFAGLADVREAERISARQPGSPEHALAVAELARVELWQGHSGGAARARRAVELARGSGSARALSYALTAQLMGEFLVAAAARPDLAQEAQARAEEAGDFLAYVHATLWWGNVVGARASDEVVELTSRARERITALGAPHCYVAWLSAVEAFDLLQTGSWRPCQERLRVALGSSPGLMGDAMARLTAALLAVWQGRLDEAAGHLARADELVAEQEGFLPLPFAAVRAELAVAAGDNDAACTAAEGGLAGAGRPMLVERLAPLAARALADEADALRDRGADAAATASRLRQLRDRFPEVVPEPGPVVPAYRRQLDAMQACYDAETARADRSDEALAAWRTATRACGAAGLRWDEAYAHWRVAETMVRLGSPRDELAAALRRAHELATGLAGAPLRERVEALARGARVSLELVPRQPEPREGRRAATGGSHRGIDALDGLTPREREVLAHVVAGRTYGEIARALVISEKTVSVHISSLLRKTGAANRVDLAALVSRLSGSGTR